MLELLLGSLKPNGVSRLLRGARVVSVSGPESSLSLSLFTGEGTGNCLKTWNLGDNFRVHRHPDRGQIFLKMLSVRDEDGDGYGESEGREESWSDSFAFRHLILLAAWSPSANSTYLLVNTLYYASRSRHSLSIRTCRHKVYGICCGKC